jgi:hypothetical protein
VTSTGTDKIGAQDLDAMIRRMPNDKRWNPNIFQNPTPDLVASANNINELLVTTRILKVLIARWTIFRVFIEVAKSRNRGTLPDDIKYTWLLFQAIRLDDKDPFLTFIEQCLANVSQDVLYSLDKITAKDVLGPDFHPGCKFFYVIDEIQVAGNVHGTCFSDDTGTEPRAVLRPIIRAMREDPSVTIIVSGTGFSLENFNFRIGSSIARNSVEFYWTVEYAIGDFLDQQVQLAYITRYLPPSFLSSRLGISLIERMSKWLRGR